MQKFLINKFIQFFIKTSRTILFFALQTEYAPLNRLPVLAPDGPCVFTFRLEASQIQTKISAREPVLKSQDMTQTDDETHGPNRARSDPESPDYSLIRSQAARSSPSWAVSFVLKLGFSIRGPARATVK